MNKYKPLYKKEGKLSEEQRDDMLIEIYQLTLDRSFCKKTNLELKMLELEEQVETYQLITKVIIVINVIIISGLLYVSKFFQ